MGYIPWDGWITLALFFVGMGAGSFIYATFLWLQNAQTLNRSTLLGWSIAPFATGLGLMILLIDLGRPERFLNALFHFNPHSILNMGVFIQNAFVGFGLLLAWLIYHHYSQHRLFTPLVWIMFGLSITVGLYHGVLPMSLGREGWNGMMIFVMFFSSLLSGRALIELLTPLPNTSKKIDIFIAISFWVVLGLWFYTLSIGTLLEQKVLVFLWDGWSYSSYFIGLLLVAWMVHVALFFVTNHGDRLRFMVIGIEFIGAFMLKLGLIFGGQISFMVG